MALADAGSSTSLAVNGYVMLADYLITLSLSFRNWKIHTLRGAVRAKLNEMVRCLAVRLPRGCAI